MPEPEHYPATVDGLRLRRVLGRDLWQPARRVGPDGWVIHRRDSTAHILVTVEHDTGCTVVTATVGRPDRMPDGDDLALLSSAVFGDDIGWRLGLVPDRDANALHLIGHSEKTQP